MTNKKNRVYLDHNATSPMRPEVREAMLEHMGRPLNPSSVHTEGRLGRKTIELARQAVADLVGADIKGVTFTSGGTEANNTVLTPNIQIGSRRFHCDHLFVSAIEHPCVLAGGQFSSENISILKVNEDGIVNLEELKVALASVEAPFVSVMLANNETGIIQPIAEIAEIVQGKGGLLHVDAVQAAGKVEISLEALGADFLTLSAHKIGGPQGVGAIIAATGGHRYQPLQKGGGQELGLRAGTENVVAIAGFGVAARLVKEELSPKMAKLQNMRDHLEAELKQLSNNIVIFGDDCARLANTTNFAIRGKRAETLVISYDMAGIAVSSGSACSSGKVGASHVLEAMGVDENLASAAIRVSTGWNTTDYDIERFLETTRRVVGS